MKREKVVTILMALSMSLLSCEDSLEPVLEGDGTTEAGGEDVAQEDVAQDEGDVQDETPVPQYSGVDILVVVDNSGSMAAEQEMLRQAFPNLIRAILDPPVNPDTGNRIHPPVRDMHIGVVSTDMGVGGYPNIQTCTRDPLVGDDGILQHTPRGADCNPTYPEYLTYAIDSSAEPDPAVVETLARDFGCIAVLGTEGCGFEQQLEAAWKALVVHSQPGGANAGFLRDDTILAILFVTDEEDCSAADPSLFDLSGIAYEINLVCYYEKEKLHSVERYATDLMALRAGGIGDVPEGLVAGFIVGVPPGAACEGRGDEVGACLDAPEMQERVRADGKLLEYVCKYPATCTTPDPPDSGNCIAEAFPARRFVELARLFEDNAVVESICTDTFVPAIGALTEKLEEIIGKIRY